MKPYRKAKNMANSDGATRFAAILSCMPNVPGIHVHKFHSIVSPWKWDVVWHASDPECRLFVDTIFTVGIEAWPSDSTPPMLT